MSKGSQLPVFLTLFFLWGYLHTHGYKHKYDDDDDNYNKSKKKSIFKNNKGRADTEKEWFCLHIKCLQSTMKPRPKTPQRAPTSLLVWRFYVHTYTWIHQPTWQHSKWPTELVSAIPLRAHTGQDSFAGTNPVNTTQTWELCQHLKT